MFLHSLNLQDHVQGEDPVMLMHTVSPAQGTVRHASPLAASPSERLPPAAMMCLLPGGQYGRPPTDIMEARYETISQARPRAPMSNIRVSSLMQHQRVAFNTGSAFLGQGRLQTCMMFAKLSSCHHQLINTVILAVTWPAIHMASMGVQGQQLQEPR